MPGSHNVAYPCMRLRRVSASMIVCSSAWPTCSEPVTLGGGITIENVGLPSCGPGLKTPASTQPAYLRSSTDDGEYVVGSSGRVVGSVMAQSLGSARAVPDSATGGCGLGDAGPKSSDPSARLERDERFLRCDHGTGG